MSWVYATADEIKKVTEKALLADFGGEEIWLPLSQLEDQDRYEEGDCDITIGMSEWIAKQKGIEDES